MKKLKYLIPMAAVLALVLLASTWHGSTAYANPFYVGTKAKSAVATSTLTYLTVGTGATTTAPVYDSYEVNGTNQPNGGNQTLPDSIAFLLRGNASSTSSVINATCEFGDDEAGPTGIVSVDWYQNDILQASTTLAGAQSIANPNSYSFQYTPQTVGGAPVLSTTLGFQKLITCPAPTRYVRLVVSISGANAGLWVGAVPKKQRN